MLSTDIHDLWTSDYTASSTASRSDYSPNFQPSTISTTYTPFDLVNQLPIPIEERVRTHLTPSSSSDIRVPIARATYRKALSPKHYVCNTCSRTFQRKYNFNKHIAIHNPDRIQTNVCQYHECKRSFGRRTDLERHVKQVHSKIYDLFCKFCNTRFSRRDMLKR